MLINQVVIEVQSLPISHSYYSRSLLFIKQRGLTRLSLRFLLSWIFDMLWSRDQLLNMYIYYLRTPPIISNKMQCNIAIHHLFNRRFICSLTCQDSARLWRRRLIETKPVWFLLSRTLQYSEEDRHQTSNDIDHWPAATVIKCREGEVHILWWNGAGCKDQ